MDFVKNALKERKKATVDVTASSFTPSLPLQMPKVQYRSNCKPSTFAYPPALEIPKEKEKEKVSWGARLALLSP